jgi:hypothetical protein
VACIPVAHEVAGSSPVVPAKLFRFNRLQLALKGRLFSIQSHRKGEPSWRNHITSQAKDDTQGLASFLAKIGQALLPSRPILPIGQENLRSNLQRN